MSNRWTYKNDGGEDYPVKRGDIWRSGASFFANLDLLTEEAGLWYQGLAATKAPPVMIYSDPPWNTSNVRSFYTKAGRPHGPDIYDILQGVFRIIALLKTPAFIEGAVKERDNFPELVRAAGGVYQRTYEITYYGKEPCLCFAATWGRKLDLPDLDGVDDGETPAVVIDHYIRSGFLEPGDAILDPCTGRGLIPKCAVEQGLRAFGTELSTHRLSCTFRKLRQVTGKDPVRVANINDFSSPEQITAMIDETEILA